MIIKNAIKNNGFSLIELLIASSIGLIAIGVVGSVFLSGYKSASQRSLELLLQQDVNDALSLLKEDILRAGYNKDKNTSYIVSGATEIVTIDTSKPTKHCISYAYHDGTVQHLRSFYTKMDEDSEDNDVRVLRLYSTTNPDRDSDDFCNGGESILDKNVIEVKEFSIVEQSLSSASATSQLLTIKLAAKIKSSAVSTTKSIQIKTRNWQ
ncbi:PilW family protein [Photobacterium damselae]|uniref:PilW family protein n=1 Tax=Photobacterium damselae TaxID=38293 RepID=UPI001EFED1EC|nr:prepilin-type N-terminal cleavage/methylation domain-containing protein [Photobacterium damselae]MCG9707002.1 prepilin-type N-terminal cleavage/methylation domain-containing protein [Photobacterium damselae]